MKPIEDLSGYYGIHEELSVVKDIRETITSSFTDLKFVEEGHKYFLNGKQLPSVSEVTHRFCQYPFDDEAEAVKYALKHGETPEYWMNQWKFTNLKATISGTAVHNFAEGVGWLKSGHPELIPECCMYQYDKNRQWLIPTRKKEEAVLKFFSEWPKNLHFVMAEARVYSNKGELSTITNPFCGTFDLLAWYENPTDKSKSGVVVLDWKTNAELTKEYSRSHDKMLLNPFGDMYEEPLSYYFLQLNLYSMCLYGIGLPVIGCRVIWLKDDGTYELIPIKMVFKEEWFRKAF